MTDLGAGGVICFRLPPTESTTCAPISNAALTSVRSSTSGLLAYRVLLIACGV